MKLIRIIEPHPQPYLDGKRNQIGDDVLYYTFVWEINAKDRMNTSCWMTFKNYEYIMSMIKETENQDFFSRSSNP